MISLFKVVAKFLLVIEKKIFGVRTLATTTKTTKEKNVWGLAKKKQYLP